MNLTLSLLSGLLILLPGIAAIAAWNHGGGEAARRPELQLTSITALCAVLVVSIGAHLVTYFTTNLVLNALVEYGEWSGWVMGQVWTNPYFEAFRFMKEKPADTLSPADVHGAMTSLGCFLALVLIQSAVMFSLVRNKGLDIVFEDMDVRGQGWAFQRVVRPGRHGLVPYARVFTALASGDRGIGFEGVIADLRQGDHGEVRVICLGRPKRFTYEMRQSRPQRWLAEPDFAVYESSPVIEAGGGGDPAVTLEGSAIRHLVLSYVEEMDADDVLEEDNEGDDKTAPAPEAADA